MGTSTFVRVRDGQSIFVRTVGKGPPVLLLHGFGLTSLQWLPFIQSYKQLFSFYIPDFRGAGRSWRCPYNKTNIFQINMEDLQDIVAHFALEDFPVVGYSMGASTALQWLKSDGMKGASRYLHVEQGANIRNGKSGQFGLFGRHQGAFMGALRTLSPAVNSMSTLGSFFTNLQAWHDSYLEPPDNSAAFDQCRIPVTFLIGKHSLLYSSTGQLETAKSVPNARVVLFENSGHLLPFVEPRKFVRELGRFLSGDG